MAHFDLSPPLTDAQVRALRVNDTVTLNKTLYGIRDATQIQLFDHGRKTRFGPGAAIASAAAVFFSAR